MVFPEKLSLANQYPFFFLSELELEPELVLEPEPEPDLEQEY